MARSSRPRRIRGPALQWRGGRESRSHRPSDEKGSAAVYDGRAASGCADAATCASRCASKVGHATESSEDGAGEVGRARKVDEGCASKSGAGKIERRAAKRGKKFDEARERAAAVATRLVTSASRRLFAVEFVTAACFF